MNAASLKLPSFAKINWFLRVLGKREDGFHDLCTVFQMVSLHDNLNFSESDSLTLTCSNRFIPTDERNLIVKAAKSLQNKFQITKGARIHLEKAIPAPGGLGGGSSNAAVALLGLATIWNLKIDFEELCALGSELGSDVPFFFYGGTALGTGRGTEILPLDDTAEDHLLIVTPNIDVSTAEAFAGLNAPRLTNETSESNLQICLNRAFALDLRQSELTNDFEQSVFQTAPEIGRVKRTLIELGARRALLCGSGASVFAVFDNVETRQTAEQAIEKENWRKFVVAAISRSEYREALKPCNSLLPISF